MEGIKKEVFERINYVHAYSSTSCSNGFRRGFCLVRGTKSWFRISIDRTTDKIISNPFYAGKITDELRGAPLSIFPYEIIYITEERTSIITVVAFSHFKRKPQWFKKRS